MKKILSAILAAIMAVSATSLAVTAQDGSGKKDVGEHTHQLMKMANAACHYEECTICYDLFNVGEHTFVDGKCSVCGHSDPTPAIKGEGEHEHIIVKNADKDSHFDECTVCFERFGVKPHEMENGVCTVCRYPYLEPDGEHRHVLMNMANMNSHYEECQVCFEIFNAGPHTFENGKCTVCGHPELVNPFTDVAADAWYTEDILSAVETGLINGKGNGEFKPDDNLTYAEAIKLAACMNQQYVDGKITLQNGNPWYSTYVEYCENKNIVRNKYKYDDYATRIGYMYIFANALPIEAYDEINRIDDGMIPDVPADAPYAGCVYKLYRAGIVTGVDAAHNCNPTASIKRSEVAVIVARMMDETKRKSFDLIAPDGSEMTDEGSNVEIKDNHPSVEVNIPDGSEMTDEGSDVEIKDNHPSVGVKLPGEREVIAPDKNEDEDDDDGYTLLPGKQEQTGQLIVNNGTATDAPDKDEDENVDVDDDSAVTPPSNIEPSGSIITNNGTITLYPDATDSKVIYTALTVVKQPKSYEADKYGIKTELEVEVMGGKAPYSYQWFYYTGYRNNKDKIANGDYVKDVTSDALVLSIEKENTLLGKQIYCEITDAEGATVKTDNVKVYGPFSLAVESAEIKLPEKQTIKPTAREYTLVGTVADGRITKGDKISVVRNGKIIAIGVAKDLQMFSKSLDEAAKGERPGIVFALADGVRPVDGDILIKYKSTHKLDTSDIIN